jgi:hypothetical protein
VCAKCVCTITSIPCSRPPTQAPFGSVRLHTRLTDIPPPDFLLNFSRLSQSVTRSLNNTYRTRTIPRPRCREPEKHRQQRFGVTLAYPDRHIFAVADHSLARLPAHPDTCTVVGRRHTHKVVQPPI